jgi:hypothetical protein
VVSDDGWEVGARFRRVFPHIGVIYTSGNQFRSELAVPESLFFPKPYETDVIVKACRSMMQELS